MRRLLIFAALITAIVGPVAVNPVAACPEGGFDLTPMTDLVNAMGLGVGDCYCTWSFVTCNGDRVTSIVQPQTYSASATIPTTFTQLTELVIIDFSNIVPATPLTMPSLLPLTQLRVLRTRGTVNSLPPSLTNLTIVDNPPACPLTPGVTFPNLVELKIINSQFAGFFPTIFTPALVILSTRGSRFAGPLPNIINNATSLRYGDLSNNNFDTLPAGFVFAPQQIFNFSGNPFNCASLSADATNYALMLSWGASCPNLCPLAGLPTGWVFTGAGNQPFTTDGSLVVNYSANCDFGYISQGLKTVACKTNVVGGMRYWDLSGIGGACALMPDYCPVSNILNPLGNILYTLNGAPYNFPALGAVATLNCSSALTNWNRTGNYTCLVNTAAQGRWLSSIPAPSCGCAFPNTTLVAHATLAAGSPPYVDQRLDPSIARASYLCDPGYVTNQTPLSTLAKARCNESGSTGVGAWVITTPCLLYANYCAAFPAPQYASSSVSYINPQTQAIQPGPVVGSRPSFNCDSTYALYTFGTLTCNAFNGTNGIWVGTVPTCTLRTCPFTLPANSVSFDCTQLSSATSDPSSVIPVYTSCHVTCLGGYVASPVGAPNDVSCTVLSGVTTQTPSPFTMTCIVDPTSSSSATTPSTSSTTSSSTSTTGATTTPSSTAPTNPVLDPTSAQFTSSLDSSSLTGSPTTLVVSPPSTAPSATSSPSSSTIGATSSTSSPSSSTNPSSTTASGTTSSSSTSTTSSSATMSSTKSGTTKTSSTTSSTVTTTTSATTTGAASTPSSTTGATTSSGSGGSFAGGSGASTTSTATTISGGSSGGTTTAASTAGGTTSAPSSSSGVGISPPPPPSGQAPSPPPPSSPPPASPTSASTTTSGDGCGTGFVDECGLCAGGDTGRQPTFKGPCGTCADWFDDCGICFGNNSDKDVCGVCFGNNATCAGCDGVPFSSMSVDVCGVCGGDNSTCVGCDGIPIPLGGKYPDACGVCGGTATGNCDFGCDGVAGSKLVFDCAGVCNGTAVKDFCGVCVGGTTGRTWDMHLDACHNCFERCENCAGSGGYDACGICGGDNSTCRGCDGVLFSLKTRDICDICGANPPHVTCDFGCDHVLDSGATYDCNGDCNSDAVLDSCGVCVGGNTGLVADQFKDSCGICFGGNRTKDQCGFCNHTASNLDSCGICGGANSRLDACGRCFGSGRDKDACGVCHGNSSTCIGCDGIVRSGKVVDNCGVCGGSGGCDPSSAILDALPPGASHVVAIGAGGGSGAALILLLFVALLWRRKKRTKIGQYYADAEVKALAAAPTGEITMVFTDIQGSTSLWEHMPDLMADALDQHNELIRRLIAVHKGYEVKTEGDAFRIAFQHAREAVEFSVALQDALMTEDFPVGIEKHKDAVTEFAPDGTTLIRRGLRVRMGMSSGPATTEMDKRALTIDYHGATVTESQAVQSVASGGQIVISESTLLELDASRDAPPGTESYAITEMGTHLLKGIGEPVTMYQVQSKALAARNHPALRHAANILIADTQRSSASLARLSARSLSSTARSHSGILAGSGGSAVNLSANSGLSRELPSSRSELPLSERGSVLESVRSAADSAFSFDFSTNGSAFTPTPTSRPTSTASLAHPTPAAPVPIVSPSTPKSVSAPAAVSAPLLSPATAATTTAAAPSPAPSPGVAKAAPTPPAGASSSGTSPKATTSTPPAANSGATLPRTASARSANHRAPMALLSEFGGITDRPEPNAAFVEPAPASKKSASVSATGSPLARAGSRAGLVRAPSTVASEEESAPASALGGAAKKRPNAGSPAVGGSTLQRSGSTVGGGSTTVDTPTGAPTSSKPALAGLSSAKPAATSVAREGSVAKMVVGPKRGNSQLS